MSARLSSNLKFAILTLMEDKISVIKQWLGSGSINLFGRQFSGKDTQGKLLAGACGGVLLGGGDIIRNSNLPPEIMKIINQGQLMPTEQYVDFVAPYLSKPELDGKPLILSAVGRWIGEEQGVINVTNKAGHPVKAVISLEISEETAVKRWEALDHSGDARGRRDDDTYEALIKRLAIFNEKTAPVIDVYKDMGLLITVDAEKSVDEINAEILQKLYERAAA